jgi:hypothetical protein
MAPSAAAKVHVMQHGVGAGEVVAGRLDRVGEEIGLHEPHTPPWRVLGSRRALPGERDHLRITVDRGNLGGFSG